MSAPRSSMDEFATGFGQWVIRWRYLVVLGCILAALAAASGGRFLGITTDYRAFFSDANPELQSYEALQRIYTKTDTVMFVVKPSQGEIVQDKTLEAVVALTERAWQIPYTTRVDSLTNYQHTTADGDDLVVEDLVQAPGSLSQEELDVIREVSQTEPVLAGRLMSRDGTTTAIVATLQLPDEAFVAVPEANAFSLALAEEIRQQYPELTIAVTGLVPLNNAFNDASLNDLKTLVPLMYGVILAVIFVSLRTITGTVLTMFVVALSAMIAMGMAGWVGIKLTPPSSIAPTIVLTIAVADSVHFLVTMLRDMRGGLGKREAIVSSMRVNFMPIGLTSLTTIIGFLSLNFSDSPPFHDLGNMAAVGAGAAWALSLLLLPALLAILPVRVKRSRTANNRSIERFAEFVIGRHKPILWTMVAVTLVFAALIPQNKVNEKFVSYFDESFSFRTDTDFATENLTGLYQIDFSLPAASEGGISDPAYLERLDAFAQWMREQPNVAHVNSFSDVIKRLNMNMHGDDPAFYKLPEGRDLSAQYLLLYEFSLPYGLDLNNQITVGKSATRLTATLDDASTNEMQAIERNAEQWLFDNAPESMHTQATGPALMFAYITQNNVRAMLFGTSAALVLISALLMLALRNFRLGLVSLIPNLVPPIIAFGIWGLFVAEISVSAAFVTATALGLIVDATVHFLSKYQRGRLENGGSVEDAIRYAFSTVGVALWVSSLVLIAGFAVLARSGFALNSTLGLLTATTIAVALVVDFFLLPALLISIDKRNETHAPSNAVTVGA